MIARIALLSATALIGGCTTLGGNVKGEFSCRAPAGTCAPTSSIDAKAVEHDADDGLAASVPARPHPIALGSVAGGNVARSIERTITIVFPPYVDAAGVLHDRAIAHAVVEPPHWAPVPADPVSFSRSPAPSSLRELVAGASVSVTEGLEPPPSQAPHPITEGALNPTAEAVAAARAGRRIERPLLPVARKLPSAPDPEDVFRPVQVPGGGQ